MLTKCWVQREFVSCKEFNKMICCTIALSFVCGLHIFSFFSICFVCSPVYSYMLNIPLFIILLTPTQLSLSVFPFFPFCVLTLICTSLPRAFSILPFLLPLHPCSCLSLSGCVRCILIFRDVPSHLNRGAMNTEWGLLVSLAACPEGKCCLSFSPSFNSSSHYVVHGTGGGWNLFFISS